MLMSNKAVKKILIKTTYDMIGDQGITNVTIRKVAAKTGYSSAALYRHFENFDHLLTYACIGYLEPYVEDFKYFKRLSNNSLEIAIQMWANIARSSFFTPEIFAQLFIGPYRDQVYQIIKDYYYIFDMDVFNVGEVSQLMLQMGELFFENENYIKHSSTKYTEEQIKILSDLTVYTYCGMLGTLMKKEYKVAEIEKMVDSFQASLKYLYS
ncbi:hypothetical protein SDC9_177534 [bioreactor metagenome]|jgi:AcrR family transcriptional regulator|uniref:HTH tetR-type domain-containing protein n=2 Tax=root TaxID=1 RepID=A0A645GTC0_9ZZZZ